jgi:hypothetical protein
MIGRLEQCKLADAAAAAAAAATATRMAFSAAKQPSRLAYAIAPHETNATCNRVRCDVMCDV